MGRGAVTNLRRASTVCLVREREHLEILMVQRPHSARFMPGVWVFPGGVVDREDAEYAVAHGLDPSADWEIAALRELIEETGVWVTTEGTFSFPLSNDVLAGVASSPYELGTEHLTYFSNWITPSVFPIRFDTRFFLAIEAGTVEAVFNEEELIGVDWVEPIEALEREARGEWDVAFPTRKTLEVLSIASSVEALVDMLESLAPVPSIEPRLHVGKDEARILLPDDPDFDAAGPSQSDPTILDRLGTVVAHGGRVPAEFKRRS
jgi:8-oxo-dGTP pyrophosphatase MutT (NUDIX family)